MTFVDEARIHVKSGDGGQGCESYYRDRWMRYPRPDGGNGGRGGNEVRKTITQPGVGEERVLDLELKLIADVGIIGFPNAGKSTFLTGISNAKSKVASYPFTTKQPILGIVRAADDDLNGKDFVIADLPGIIEGAHRCKGLGDRFLRHAERTKILLHMIDMAGTEGRDPLDDYAKIEHELKEYSDQLMSKHKVVAANKMDLPAAAEHLKRFRKKYKKEKVFAISSLNKEGFEPLIQRLQDILC